MAMFAMVASTVTVSPVSQASQARILCLRQFYGSDSHARQRCAPPPRCYETQRRGSTSQLWADGLSGRSGKLNVIPTTSAAANVAVRKKERFRMVTSTDRSSYPRPVTPEIGVLRPAKPFSSGCLEALCLHHQLGGGRGDEANQRLAGVLLLTARNYTS